MRICGRLERALKKQERKRKRVKRARKAKEVDRAENGSVERDEVTLN